jgi:hypothetical protein
MCKATHTLCPFFLRMHRHGPDAEGLVNRQQIGCSQCLPADH